MFNLNNAQVAHEVILEEEAGGIIHLKCSMCALHIEMGEEYKVIEQGTGEFVHVPTPEQQQKIAEHIAQSTKRKEDQARKEDTKITVAVIVGIALLSVLGNVLAEVILHLVGL